MSNKYKIGIEVPSGILAARLEKLSDAVTKGRKSIDREFYMSVPAQVDNDADLVISEAARRIHHLESQLETLRKENKRLALYEEKY